MTRVVPGVTPVAYSNLTAEEITAHYTVEDVPMILSNEPGVHAYSESGNGTGYSYVSIRGFDQSRIAVMLDNVPLNDNESHQVYWVDHGDILSDASDVEIQRGIGNSLYGATAFGGSINVQTKISSDDEQLSFTALGGSYNTFKGSAKYYSGQRFGENWSLAARLSAINTNGYRVDSESNQKAFTIGVEHRTQKLTNQFRALIGNEFSKLQWDGVSSEMINDRSLRNGKMEWTAPFTDDFLQQIYSLNTRWNINDNLVFRNTAYLVAGSGFYEVDKTQQSYYNYNLDINDEYSDEEEVQQYADFTRRKWIINNYYGIVPTITHRHNNLRTDIGLEMRQYSGDHFGEVINVSDIALNAKLPDVYRYYDYTGKKQLLTAFGHLVYSFPIGLNFIADLQLQNINWTLDQNSIGHAEGYSPSANWTFLNPRFGLSYELWNGFSVFGNYGTAQKEPADAQIIEADDVWSRPKEVAAEKITDIEIGLSLSHKGNFFKLNLYQIDYLNEIISDIYDFTEGEFDVVTADATVHKGIEIEGKYSVNSNLSIGFNSSITNNYFSGGVYDGNHLINIPDNLFNIFVNYSPVHNLSLLLNGKYVGQQYIDFENSEQSAIDPYFLTNFAINYNWKYIGLNFRINNLFDKLYATYGYEYWGGYYWPGATRNFSFSVNVTI